MRSSRAEPPNPSPQSHRRRPLGRRPLRCTGAHTLTPHLGHVQLHGHAPAPPQLQHGAHRLAAALEHHQLLAAWGEGRGWGRGEGAGAGMGDKTAVRKHTAGQAGHTHTVRHTETQGTSTQAPPGTRPPALPPAPNRYRPVPMTHPRATGWSSVRHPTAPAGGQREGAAHTRWSQGWRRGAVCMKASGGGARQRT